MVRQVEDAQSFWGHWVQKGKNYPDGCIMPRFAVLCLMTVLRCSVTTFGGFMPKLCCRNCGITNITYHAVSWNEPLVIHYAGWYGFCVAGQQRSILVATQPIIRSKMVINYRISPNQCPCPHKCPAQLFLTILIHVLKEWTLENGQKHG